LFQQLVESLVRVPSVNGDSEAQFGTFLRGHLDARLGKSVVRLEVADSRQRPSFISLKPGASRDWIVLLGHYDTVGVSDYGALADLAFEPVRLREALKSDPRLTKRDREDIKDDRFIWGRGALDMKAGVALLAETVRELADHAPASLALVLVPDEEGDSSGIRTALPVLLQEIQDRGGRVAGVIKTDFTEDTGVVYAGTTGKLLLNAFVRGVSGHAGKPEAAISAASVLADLEAALRSFARITPPPACLHLQTLTGKYSTQIPSEGWMFVNLMIREERPQDILEDTLEVVRAGVGKKYDLPVVLLGFGSSEPAGDDPRRESLAAVRKTATEPGIYLYLTPPFYAPMSADFSRETRLGRAVRRSIQDWNRNRTGHRASLKPFYPYISDLSFFYSDEGTANFIQKHCPVSLDFRPLMSAKERVPVFDIGPFGMGAHRWTERVDIADAELRVKVLLKNTILCYYEG
jgi:arginine utilization protein RocB